MIAFQVILFMVTKLDNSLAIRSALVDKLVTDLHLNCAERALIHPTLRRNEVIEAIRRVLARSGRFPSHAETWMLGKVVFEGYFLEEIENGGVRLWWQRSNPIDFKSLEQSGHQDFAMADEAIAAFVSQEWSDKMIDGIRFE